MEQNYGDDSLVTPFFKTVARYNAAESEKAGIPIYRDVDVVEVRFAGNDEYMPVFDAGEMWKRGEDGEALTYADRWPEAYARFIAGREQIADGTPLSEVPFLTEAQRRTLRDLRVYTCQALASMDGRELKALGPHGRELQQQAKAFLDAAKGTADTTAMAAEMERLRQRIAELENGKGASKDNPFAAAQEAGDDAAEKAQLRDEIEALSGSRPKGNPSVETLRGMVADLREG